MAFAPKMCKLLGQFCDEAFKKVVVSGVETWPQLNADFSAIASGVQDPGQFCTNWT
jgi:hypothetical protein